MATQNIPFVEIENYIRNLIFKNCGVFDRNTIMMQSHEWMQKFPVEFNGILNFIENEERNDDMMDDSTPSVAFGSGFADDSTPSVAFGSRFADDSTPSVAFGSRFADDSTPSVAFGSRFADDSTPSVAFGGYADDSTPSVAHYEEYSGNIMPDPMSSISDSPMGSDHIDSSPGGYPDEFESDMPLQRTMSHGPPRN
jgi:hypothetical protein